MASTSADFNGSRRLFIDNLPPYAKRKDLLKVFASDGAQRVHLVKCHKTRIAFVTFEGADAANRALERVTTNRLFLYKRHLVVKKADPLHDLKIMRRLASIKRVISIEGNATPVLIPEVMKKIASFLPYADRARMECVSRTWRQGSMMSHGQTTCLSTKSSLWGQGRANSVISSKEFYWALQRVGPYLKALILHQERCTKDLRPSLLTIAAKACRDLEMVDLRGAITRPSGIRALAVCTTKLRVLILGRSLGTLDPELENLFRLNTHLETLEFYKFRFTGRSLLSLTSDLVHLKLVHCPKLESESAAEFLGRTTSLRILEIIECQNFKGGAVLNALSQNAKIRETLEVLVIYRTAFLQIEEPDEEAQMDVNEDDMGLFVELNAGPVEGSLKLPANLRSVEELTLTAVGWVDNNFVREIALHMKSLRALDLSICTNIRGLFALQPLGKLTELIFLKINSMYPDVGGDFLSMLFNLRAFEGRNNEGLHSDHVCGLLRRATNINHLDLEGCANIGQPVVACAIEAAKAFERNTRLEIFLAGTSAPKCRHDEDKFFLRIHYDRKPRRRM